MKLRILHTNDMHGHLDAALFERLRELRKGADLYFDTGDVIRAGNLAIPLRGDEAWPRLAALDCTASVPGNRESHVLDAAFHKKLEGRQHPVLCGNMRWKDGSLVLPDRLITESNGIRVGIFGVMVPIVTERMKTRGASAFLWEQPLPVARRIAAELRPQVDLVVALTHIGYRLDVELALSQEVIDVIFGGHSHSILESPELHGKTYVCQGGSHGRWAGSYEWDGSRLAGELIPLK